MLKDKQIMPPLWLAYPNIERYSIGWRMGYGESYAFRFFDWLYSLSESEKSEYKELFPEPITWQGWWEDEETDNAIFINKFHTYFWNENGKPKYSRKTTEQDFANNKEQNFTFFWGHHTTKNGELTKACLSQWYLSDFWSLNHNYCCMEQFMMANKAILFKDNETLSKILNTENQGNIKSLGRKVKNFEQEIWDKYKYSIVLNGNFYKFMQNEKLRNFLLATGDRILAEASPYDKIWGIGLSENTSDILNPKKWLGENLLGFALMEVRDEIRRITQNEFLCNFNLIIE